ncbi:MAG TPA: tetratricopeptide repeat protein [Sphingobacteriaceae bacterium]|nr:tetratricopeptide repeat protein [Sphingobacteriaceae bacterium]
MKILMVLLAFTVFAPCAFAQIGRTNNGKVPEAVPLSTADSLMVKHFYFGAIREKTIANYQLAADMFKRVIDIDPKNDAAMYELSNIYNAQNQEKKAEEYIKSAVAINPDNEWYWLLLADIYKRNNNLPGLVPVFNELIRIKPNTDDFYFDKANAFVRQNKIKEAAAVYSDIEKYFGLSDNLEEARQRLILQSGKPGNAIEHLEKLIEKNPSEVKNYIYLGDLYLKAGDKDKSLNILKKGLDLDPSNVFVRLSLADLYRSTGKFDNAFIELKEAFANQNLQVDQKVRIVLSFFPMFSDERARTQAEELATILVKTHQNDPKAYAVLGDVLFQDKKYAEAKTAYRAALKLNEQVYMIWEQLLRIQLSDGEFNAAIEDGEVALTIFPNQAPLYLYTGIAYSQIQKHEKAISYLKNAANLEVEDKGMQAQIYSSLGDAYNAIKYYKESDYAYDKSLELTPDNTYVLNNYAYYLSLRGESLNKAEQMSRRSNVLEPNNPSFEDTLAWILFKTQNYREAKLWIEKAIKNDKRRNSTQLDHYGDILFHLNDKASAVNAWKQAKSAGSKSEVLEKKINEKKYFD